jgi:hypothetical protein
MANVCVFTVNQIERIEGPGRYPGLATIEATLKAKGIVFVYGGTPRVRVRRKRKK